MMEMDRYAIDLLKKALQEIGADGLVNVCTECGCGLDDFAPCGECNIDECEAATKKGKKTGALYYPMKAVL
jgi:hypothetical protein